MGANVQQSSARQYQIVHIGQGKQLRFILCQAPVARLPVLEEIFDHVEGMFDLGANARLEFLGLFAKLANLVAWQSLAVASFNRHMPAHRGIAVLFTLAYPLVARITKYQCFLAMQQRTGLAHIADVARPANYRMH